MDEQIGGNMSLEEIRKLKSQYLEVIDGRGAIEEWDYGYTIGYSWKQGDVRKGIYLCKEMRSDRDLYDGFYYMPVDKFKEQLKETGDTE